MYAVVTRNAMLGWEEIPAPRPGDGQVRVRTLACGICGTDLHARGHLHEFLEGLRQAGTPLSTNPDEGIVFGHEFCGEVIEHGLGTRRDHAEGTRVVGLPFAVSERGTEYVGYSDRLPGGFAPEMVLTERLLFEVPNGLSSVVAALTEPFAVGAHAVARARVPDDALCVVVGCGPIGLAVIAGLKARGIDAVVATEYSASRRRLAEAMGAQEVVDATGGLSDIWDRYRRHRGTRVVFECVGKPGVAQEVIAQVPRRTVVVVVGNSLQPTSIDQVMAFNKELDLVFSMNYTVGEFAQTLKDLAEGRLDSSAYVTSVVSPQQVPQAFEDLQSPEQHAKIVVSFE